VQGLTFYQPVPTEPLPNDDLDLQLVWLKMPEDRGVDPSLRDFAEYWERYAARYPWNEYGFFMRNRSRVGFRLADGREVSFTVVGPGEAQGYAAGTSVATCPGCGAWIEACFCANA
jgi:hypothetical protein